MRIFIPPISHINTMPNEKSKSDMPQEVPHGLPDLKKVTKAGEKVGLEIFDAIADSWWAIGKTSGHAPSYMTSGQVREAKRIAELMDIKEGDDILVLSPSMFL